jgi:hypothetical protein
MVTMHAHHDLMQEIFVLLNDSGYPRVTSLVPHGFVGQCCLHRATAAKCELLAIKRLVQHG